MFATGYSSIENDIVSYEIPTENPIITTNRVVVLALDESLTAQYAFQYAKDKLLRPNDLVCLLNVMPTNSPPPLESLDVGAMFVDTGYLSEQQKYNEQHSKWLLKTYKKLLNNKTRLFSLVGDNRDEIVRACHNLHANLAILGSRDLSGLHRLFLGSTSDYCIHNLECPVFIVKPPEHVEVAPILSADTTTNKSSKSD